PRAWPLALQLQAARFQLDRSPVSWNIQYFNQLNQALKYSTKKPLDRIEPALTFGL
ncbi:MAG: hypothetical protein ACI9PN_002670, partial [Candidatus Azotimanducaceae bacterium]